MNLQYNISTINTENNVVSSLSARAAKGHTNVTLNFNFNNIIKLLVSDDRRLIHSSALSNIPSTLTFTISPDDSEYAIMRYIEIIARFDSFNYNKYILPIYIAQPSYYNYLEGLKIENTQFLDNLTADIFAVLKTDSNQHYHTIIKANEISTNTTNNVVYNALITSTNKYIQTSQADVLIVD